jgi:hypothetical protein
LFWRIFYAGFNKNPGVCNINCVGKTEQLI